MDTDLYKEIEDAESIR